MDGIFKRLGMADAEQSRLIINPPADYEALLKENGLAYDTDVEQDSYDVIQIFGTANEEIMQFASLYIDFLNETGVIWLSYPKKTSKKYRNSVCNHSTVSDLLVDYPFEPKKQVSIDQDFSALQFVPKR